MTKETQAAGGGNGGLHIALVSLYHYGAFGSRVLADVLRQNGHTVTMIFFKRDKTNEMSLPTPKEYALLVGLLEKLSPGLIGISTRSAFFPVARDLTAAIKARLSTPVAWGGAHAIICPEECVKYADLVCTGEGEEPLSRLAAALARKEDYTKIPGFWFRTPAGEPIKNESAPVTADLDALPLPDFSDAYASYVIEDDRCENVEPLYNDSLTHYNFMTGRGCPFNCDFCSNSVLHPIFAGRGPQLRQRSVDSVIRELALVKKTFRNLASVSSNDELFGMRPQWLLEFARRYKEEIGLAFHCDIHPAYVTEEKIAALSAMGLKTISMGIQSGNEHIRLEFFGRNTPDAMIVKAANLFKKYRIFPSYDLIFDNPFESEADIRNTLHFMLGLPGPFRLNLYSLQHHPKTALTKKLLALGKIGPQDVDGVSLKGLNKWHVRVDQTSGGTEMVFLQRLFLMLGSHILLSKKHTNRVIPVFPRCFIRFLDRTPVFRRNLLLTGWVYHLPRLTFAAGLVFQLDFSGLFLRIARRLGRRKGTAVRG
jgi:radical SAM superfamily enzyme YgiQ (UPF0313 family)